MSDVPGLTDDPADAPYARAYRKLEARNEQLETFARWVGAAHRLPTQREWDHIVWSANNMAHRESSQSDAK